MTGPYENAEWAAGIQALHVEAGGDGAGALLTCAVVSPADRLRIMTNALAGDATAAQLLHAVQDAVRRIEAAPKRRPMLCGSCPRPLRGRRYAVVVVRAARDDGQQAMTLAICPHCASTKRGVEQKAVKALARIWPDLRQIDVAAVGGHA